MRDEEDTYREGIKEDLKEIKKDQQEIKALQRYTNGKVRKIIIALAILGGIILGQALSGKELITAFLHTAL